MKKRRLISGLIAGAMLLLSSPVMAQEEVSINPAEFADNVITVSGRAPAPKTRIYIEVIRQGKDMLDVDHVYAARQVATDDNGSFSICCEMPEMDRAEPDRPVDGYFTIHVAAAGFARQSLDFSYISEQSRKTFFETLNGSAMQSAATLAGFMENTDNALILETYQINSGEFNAFSDSVKEKAYQVIRENGVTFDETNLAYLNEVIITMRLNGLKTAEDVKGMLDSEDISSRCDLTFGEISYASGTDEVRDWFAQAVLEKSGEYGFGAVSQLDTLFDEAMALLNVNKTHYSKLYAYLKENSDLLRLDKCSEFSSISKLSAKDQESVMAELKKLSDSIKNVDMLHSLLKEAYQNYKPSGGGKAPSGGRQPSGGNIISTGSIPKQDTEPVKKPEDATVYFTDLDGYTWAEEAVNVLAANQVIAGDGNGKFSPERNVTRAEFLKMLLSALDLVDPAASCNFQDVKPDDWCYPYIASAYANGITSGIDEDTFGKDSFITRQEAAVFMHRAAVRVYLPLDGAGAEEFDDAGEIADWAARSVKIMRNAGFINGVGENRFGPMENTTRAQAARMVYGLFELMK